MADSFTTAERSACMRAVGSKNTQPEMQVRRLVHSMGYRYALHAEYLPGKPDLVLVSRRKIIFVHGCFWHKHSCHRGQISPMNNQIYWQEKRNRNSERDSTQIKALRKDGWKVLVVWECWTKDLSKLNKQLHRFLTSE